MSEQNPVKVALAALSKLYAGFERPSRRQAGMRLVRAPEGALRAVGSAEPRSVDEAATPPPAPRDSYLSRYDLQVRAAGRAPDARR